MKRFHFERKPEDGLCRITKPDSDCCLIVTGGDLEPAFAADFIRSRSYGRIIAADAGLRFLAQARILPDQIVGDFDTLEPEIFEEFRKDERICRDIHQPEKDETDTELALMDALSAGFHRMEVLGAFGGRIDHELANIQLLYEYRKKGAFISLIDPRNRISMAWSGRVFRKDSQFGKYISFLPLTTSVTGITLRGFKYPLENRDIEIRRPLLISNEIVEDTAEITFDGGELIVIESCDKSFPER